MIKLINLFWCLGAGVCMVNNSSTSLSEIAQLLRSDVRIIAMGDSLNTAFWKRTLTHGLRVWPIPKISAIGGGAGIGAPLIRCEAFCQPYENVLNPDPFGYMVERQSQPADYFALPIRGIKEIYTDEFFLVSEKNGNLFEFNINYDEFNDGVHGRFSWHGDNLRFRLLYRAPENISQQPTSLKLKDVFEDVLIFNPQTNARKLHHLGEVPDGSGRVPISSQINAVTPDIPAHNQLGYKARVYLAEHEKLAGSNKYFNLAGGIYYHADANNQPVPGLYFTSVADDGWRFEGFYRDEPAVFTHDKTFTKEQFTHWLDVTTLRLNQPVVFVWKLSNEICTVEEFQNHFEGMIQQAEYSANQVGLPEVHHLIVTSHLHLFGGDLKLSHALSIKQQKAAQIVAAKYDNVASISLYEATGGIFFDGSEESIQWLTDRGFENFEFGTIQINLVDYANEILDINRTHPGSYEGAAFFAAIMGNEIRKGACPADFIADGVIDVNDLMILLDGWGTGGQSDLNKDGTTDVNDLLLFIDAWGECWPVQAPFSTGQFE